VKDRDRLILRWKELERQRSKETRRQIEEQRERKMIDIQKYRISLL
jgi:hypothetical protein